MLSRYTVTDDLHVVPGAKLTIAPGSILEFHEGIGMLVQVCLTPLFSSLTSIRKLRSITGRVVENRVLRS